MNIAGLSLRDLEYAVAVADHRHFGKAAERCSVSQPSLSAQVRKLEELLGVTLFERTSRRVLVTAQGEAVIRQARVVLEEAQKLLAVVRGTEGTLLGRLSVGAIQTLGPYLFPHLLPAMRRHLPGVQLVLSEGRTEGLLDELREGRLDAVLLSLPIGGEGLTCASLFFEPFVLAHPAGHRLEGLPTLALADLDPGELVLLEEGHCLRDQALAVCGATARGLRHATGLETLRHMVAAGAGTTLMPLLATGDGATVGGLVAYRPFHGDDPPGRVIGLVWRAGDPRAPGFRALADRLRAAAPLGVRLL
ncbi:LysR substrate-binding domain-containing protein [Azospirillum canadense]|uniref:LysR substrate-binding domain-containing protein n=1 Tax=Azospirillum canadense TaxID=403962 RepID=UPI0022260BAD|nr:LysR substrate-binding domain-containing protein [Azospirillum canadense]MCW2244003.1 LysR family hydrogen peroxide-inducible transcriptional activator [Azospirillum canadense]